MGRYTVYGREVDKEIEERFLNPIKEIIVKELNPISIVLFGGFGKGEGSVEFVNKKVMPFNDFDLYVITKKNIPDEELDRVSIKCSKSIGMGGLEIAYYPGEGYDRKKFFHVDIRCISLDKLGKLLPTQRYYELKYGSKVIYGDENILNKIKPIKEIPVSEGLRNLFNKLHTMLLGLRKGYNEDEKKAVIFWSYKTYLSCCEALLILSKNFAPTYGKRAKLFKKRYKKEFPELYKKIPDLAEKVEEATNFKQRLNFKKDYKKLWNNTLEDILIVFEYYINQFSMGSVEEVINHKLPYIYFKPYLKNKIGINLFFLQYILNLRYFNILRKKDKLYFRPLLNWKDVGLRMILPIYYLLKSVDEELYLKDAFNYTKKFIKVDKKEFWHLRERALRAYGLYYEQRLL